MRGHDSLLSSADVVGCHYIIERRETQAILGVENLDLAGNQQQRVMYQH
jgi:hypothetical protein